MIDLRELTVCQTGATTGFHLRKGSFKACGEQDTETLCGKKPRWDVKCPVTVLSHDVQGFCKECKELANIGD